MCGRARRRSGLREVTVAVGLKNVDCLGSLFVLTYLVTPTIVVCLVKSTVGSLCSFSGSFGRGPSLASLVSSVGRLLLSVKTKLTVKVTMATFYLKLLVVCHAQGLRGSRWVGLP